MTPEVFSDLQNSDIQTCAHTCSERDKDTETETKTEEGGNETEYKWKQEFYEV